MAVPRPTYQNSNLCERNRSKSIITDNFVELMSLSFYSVSDCPLARRHKASMRLFLYIKFSTDLCKGFLAQI